MHSSFRMEIKEQNKGRKEETMSDITTAVQIQDRISEPLHRINNTINFVTINFERIQQISQNIIDMSSLNAADNGLKKIGMDVKEVGERIRETRAEDEKLNEDMKKGSVFSDLFKNSLEKTKGVLENAGVDLSFEDVFNRANEKQQAINSFQVKTGLDSKEMTGVNESISNLYRDNMGEGYDDIANSMAVVFQTTGKTGEELEKTTRAALLVKDAFGYDVADSIKTADELQKQFGINSDQAYNLIAQGAQNGLDKVEDLSANGILALKDMKNGIDFSKNALDEINNLKYDDAGSAFASLGRTINDQLASSVGEAINFCKNIIIDFTSGLQGNLEEVQGIFGYIGYGLLQAGNIIQMIAGLFIDYWSAIAPIILGVAAALLVYMIATKAATTVSGIATTVTDAWKTAQTKLNAVLAMNPIALVIISIILLISLVYAAVAAINKMTGSTYSGTGIICGCINVVIQFFVNLGMMVANISLGIWEVLKAVSYNMVVAFNNAIYNVKADFWSLLESVITVATKIANCLNKIFCIEIDTSGLENAASDYAAKARKELGKQKKYKGIEEAFNKGNSTYDAFKENWTNEAFDKGNQFGKGIEEKLKGVLGKDKKKKDNIFDPLENMNLEAFYKQKNMPADKKQDQINNAFRNSQIPNASKIPSDVNEIKNNTKKNADTVDTVSEDFQYLRDLAEREAVNRFTTAEVKVEMGGVINQLQNSNDVSDIDKMIGMLTLKLNEMMHSVAEGVHYV